MRTLSIDLVVADNPEVNVFHLPRSPFSRKPTAAVRWNSSPELAFWIHSDFLDRGTRGRCYFPRSKGSPSFQVVCECCEGRYETKTQMLARLEYLEAVATVCKEHGVKTLFTRWADGIQGLVRGIPVGIEWKEVTKYDVWVDPALLAESSEFMHINTD